MKTNAPMLSPEACDAITTAAQNARLYRIAARRLRTEAAAMPVGTRGHAYSRMLKGALRLERNARQHETRIVAAAVVMLA